MNLRTCHVAVRVRSRFIPLVIMFHQHLACAADVYCKCRDMRVFYASGLGREVEKCTRCALTSHPSGVA